MSVRVRGVGLVQACDDPRLLGFRLWPRQRELLGSVETGPRLHVWALGRRSGKTTLAALVALWDCLLRPELGGMTRPGERRHAVCIATNLRQARLFVRAAVSVVERSPLLSAFVQEVTEDEILFSGGSALSAFPCTSRGARGWPVSTLLMDEAAHFVSDTEGPQVAERVFSSLAPSTAQFGDASRIIVASTPYGQSGFFSELFAQANSGELEDASAHRCSTEQANPTIDPGFLQREQARDPDGYRSEYLAEFLGGGHAYLDPERITDAVADRGELPPEAGHSWVAGLDPAFSSDPFGLAIVGRPRHRDPDRPEQLLLALAPAWRPERRKAGSFEERREVEDQVLAEVADVCLHYGARVVTDQYAAAPIVAYLRRRGLAVRTVPMTATSKTECFAALRGRLNFGQVELYDQPNLLAELRRLRTRYTAGSASVVNPRVGGSHGDMAQALALAVAEHARYGGGGGSVGYAGPSWWETVEPGPSLLEMTRYGKL